MTSDRAEVIALFQRYLLETAPPRLFVSPEIYAKYQKNSQLDQSVERAKSPSIPSLHAKTKLIEPIPKPVTVEKSKSLQPAKDSFNDYLSLFEEKYGIVSPRTSPADSPVSPQKAILTKIVLAVTPPTTEKSRQFLNRLYVAIRQHLAPVECVKGDRISSNAVASLIQAGGKIWLVDQGTEGLITPFKGKLFSISLDPIADYFDDSEKKAHLWKSLQEAVRQHR